MGYLSRIKNRLITRAAARFPALRDHLVRSYQAWEAKDTPWTPVAKPLARSTIAMVTTAGVHHRHQAPFDMTDPNGDPTYRVLDSATIGDDYIITHDYYDHRDADKDLNIVLPIRRLAEMAAAGVIGGVATRHVGFMGHIDKEHILTLINRSAPETARIFKSDQVDAVLLIPG